VLGAAWSDLDSSVRRAHPDGTAHAEGTLRVSHGAGWLRRLVLWLGGLPTVSEGAPVRLVVGQQGQGERWQRAFGRRRLVTDQYDVPGGLLGERLGLLELRFHLAVEDGALVYRQAGLALRLGRWRAPLPHRLAFRVAGREGPATRPDRTCLSVVVADPWGGLIFAYAGEVRWREAPA